MLPRGHLGLDMSIAHLLEALPKKFKIGVSLGEKRWAGQPTSSAICSSRTGGPETSIVVMQVSRQRSRSSRIFSGGPTR